MAVDVASVIAELLGHLIAPNVSTLIWWSETEIYHYANRAAAGLALSCNLLAGDETIATTPMDPTYALPASFIGPLAVESGGYVRPQSGVAALDALAPQWSVASAPDVERYCLDSDGPGYIRFVPIPEGEMGIRLLFRARPADATPAAPVLDLPPAAREVIWLSVLAGARAKDGKAAMPDVSTAADQALAILTTAAKDIWGVA